MYFSIIFYLRELLCSGGFSNLYEALDGFSKKWRCKKFYCRKKIIISNLILLHSNLQKKIFRHSPLGSSQKKFADPWDKLGKKKKL